MPDLSDAAESAERSDVLDHAVRYGLVAYGLVHLMVAWLALRLATDDREGSASGTGALKELAQQPLGGLLVWAVGIGLGLLVVWRVLEGLYGRRDEDGAARIGKRALSFAKAGVYAALAVTAIRTATGDSGGGGGAEQTLTARLMSLPFGTALVWMVAVGVAAWGVSLVVIAWRGDFVKHLEAEGTAGTSGSAHVAFGRAGYTAKGAAVLLVSGLFGYAAHTNDPDESGGIDVALRGLLDEPFGPWLVAAVAAGLAAYGLFCFARARHLDR